LEEEIMIETMGELGITVSNRLGTPGQPSALQWQTPIAGRLTSSGVLHLTRKTADWVVEAVKQLEAIGRLRNGWDSYGGLPLNLEVKNFVVGVLRSLETDNLPTPAVVLCSPGTVQLEWRALGGKELEIELKEGGIIEFVKVSPQGDVQGGLAQSNVFGELANLTSWLQHG
jgi:hypothetical protein